MKKIASAIVRFRYVLTALMLLLCIPAALNIGGTGINYDLTSYLSSDTMTRRGMDIMEQEFESTSSLSLVLIDAGEEEAAETAEAISALDGVMTARHDPVSGVRTEEGTVYRLISIISSGEKAESVYDAVESLVSGKDCLLSGAVRDSRTLRRSMSEEIPVVMAVSCAIVLAVLLLMCPSFAEPILFFVCIAVSVCLNMGTNTVFGSISFITFAVAAILQLALAMDYSIMLINAYDRMLASGLERGPAMAAALEKSFMPVSSSALTTVAGMISLVFMSFTIGFDIGMVLAKGIVISMLTVFLMMPGLLTLFTPLMRRTSHRPVHLSGRGLSRLNEKSRGSIAAVLILIILAGAVIQTGNTYVYTVRDMDGESEKVTSLFGREDPLVLLFPLCRTEEDYAAEEEMLGEMRDISISGRPAVVSVLAMPVTAEAALKTYDAASAAALVGVDEGVMQGFFSLMGISGEIRGDEMLRRAEALADGPVGWMVPAGARDMISRLSGELALAEATFNGKEWSRAVLSLDVSYTEPGAAGVLEGIREIMNARYGSAWAMTGNLVATDDIGSSFPGDVMRVGWITAAAVFMIILLSFRNLAVPVILVCVIQGAIWVNMAFSGLVDGSVFFMCYLICMALQMGATIDYGILLTAHYRTLRETMAPEAAAAGALDISMQTILTSGMALITAGFAVGGISSVFYISSIGTMLGRGAVVSVLLVLFLLPRLLVRADRWVAPGAQGSAKE